MKVADALKDITRLFLDTAPFIYLVERNPRYFDVVFSIFARIDNGQVAGITSPVTLAESLVIPQRLQSLTLRQEYIDQIVHGPNTTFVTLDDRTADQAADFRARYNLALADAFQAAAAIRAGCEALLTNDAALRRVIELHVLLVDDLEP